VLVPGVYVPVRPQVVLAERCSNASFRGAIRRREIWALGAHGGAIPTPTCLRGRSGWRARDYVMVDSYVVDFRFTV
jgi:hypothetical protein